jgi:hypothetical protein
LETERLKNASIIDIGDAEGDFNGKVMDRTWNIIMHADRKPASVRYNKDQLPGESYSWDESRNELTIK